MLNLAVRNTGKLIREKSKSENIRLGRLFTKKNTAALMAKMIKLDPAKKAYTILDPGAGTGILSAAIIEHICKNAPECRQIFLTCYEPSDEFADMQKLSDLTSVPIPAPLAGLAGRRVLHTDTVDVSEMPAYVARRAEERK